MNESSKRVGASSFAKLSPRIKTAIENGQIDCATHVEQMAVDMGRVLAATEPVLSGRKHEFSGLSFLGRMRKGGDLLYEQFGSDSFERSPSTYRDIARGWQAFSAGAATGELTRALTSVEKFAQDSHFAVREFAWLAVRHWIVDQPVVAIEALGSRAASDDPYLIRFAVELSRPRSVWGRHSIKLKVNPEIAEELLRSAANNESPYVVNAIGNWLQDAAVTRPDWALDFSARLLRSGASALLARRISRLGARINSRP